MSKDINEELLVALENLFELVKRETNLPGCCANGNTDPSGMTDEGVVFAGRILEDARVAIERAKKGR